MGDALYLHIPEGYRPEGLHCGQEANPNPSSCESILPTVACALWGDTNYLIEYPTLFKIGSWRYLGESKTMEITTPGGRLTLLTREELRSLQEVPSVSARSAPDNGSSVWWNMPLRKTLYLSKDKLTFLTPETY